MPKSGHMDTPPRSHTPLIMSKQPICIISVNMRRRNAAFSAFLQTTDFDIVLVQEPWFHPIRTARSDFDPEGAEVLGTIQNDQFLTYLPIHSGTDICKVAIFVCAELARSISIIPLLAHPAASLSSMVMDIIAGDETLCVYNIYHDCPESGHGLQHLLTHSLEDTIPTVLLGDFNTHSPTWSLPGKATSAWAGALEDWFDKEGLTIQNPPGVPTWHGTDKQHPSVLDLMLLNEAALFADQMSPLTISFKHSIGSDHAALSTAWYPLLSFPVLPPEPLPGFAIDDALKEQWCVAFRKLHCQDIVDTLSLEAAAQCLEDDINCTCAKFFPRRHAPDPRGACWWNADCSTAISLVNAASAGKETADAVHHLCRTVTAAKWKWAEDFLKQATLEDL